jgi:hypothetical protein
MENSIIRTVTIPLSEYEFLKDTIQQLQIFKNNNGYLIEEYSSYRHTKYYCVIKDIFIEKLSDEIKQYRKINQEYLVTNNGLRNEIKKLKSIKLKTLFQKIFNL